MTATATRSHRVHGTYVKYVIDKCRCDDCRRANSDYVRANERRRAIERWHPEKATWVDADPVRAHVRSLMASGLGQTDGVGLKQIAKVSGVSHGALWKLVYGKRRSNGEQIPSRRVHRDTAAKLLAVSRDDRAPGATLDDLETRRVWHQVDELIAWYNAEVGAASGNGYGRHPTGGKTWLGRILTGNPKALSLQLSRCSITVRHARMIRDLHDQKFAESESFRWRFCTCDDVGAEDDSPKKVPIAPLLPFLEGANLGALEEASGVNRRQLTRLRNSSEAASITWGLFDRIAVGLGRPELAS